LKGRFVELGSIAEFINGAAFKPSDWTDKGKRIIRIQNLTDPTKPFNRTRREVIDKLHVQPGDLLVSWSASLGVFEWHGADTALLNQHIFRVVHDSARIDKRYLRYGLERALLEMKRHLHGATMQHVNRGEFLATRLYLPPLPEQRRIAQILDKTNTLRTKRRAATVHLTTLVQSVFLDMFGDPINNEQNWQTCSLKDVAVRITDGTHKTPVYQESGIEFLSAKDLKDGGIAWGTGKFISKEAHLELMKRCNPEIGDILLAKSGSLGSVAIVDRPHDFSLFESLCLIKHDRSRIDSRFLIALLRTPTMLRHLLRQNKGVAIKHLHLVDVRNLRIPVPPLNRQQEFALRAEATDKLRMACRASISSLEGLFVSLQERAFRGNL
jgi:type I restriction enzyme S subunit